MMHDPVGPAAETSSASGHLKIETVEAMRRYREGEAGDRVFERLLGIEMKREQYVAGRAFCDTGGGAHRRGHLTTM